LDFVLIDITGKGKNVTSMVFSELEGDFLAGALAALLSPSGRIGYLGGADVTVIHRIEGEIPPNSGTTEIATPYELRGDTLILGHDSTAHWKFLRVRP